MFEGVNTQRFRGGRLGRANSVKFANSDKNWTHFFIFVEKKSQKSFFYL
jgi:hypothetical protein|tara:strand:- start:488 stop:634 length:147 start_codon:yes stop_codon:yes gene_type:complete